MDTRWTVFFPDGTMESGERDMPETPGFAALEAMCAPIVGGHIERVRVWHDGGYLETSVQEDSLFEEEPLHDVGYLDMFVHESGLLEGLPLNARATALYHANLRKHAPAEYEKQKLAGALSPIAGPAVLFHRRVWF